MGCNNSTANDPSANDKRGGSKPNTAKGKSVKSTSQVDVDFYDDKGINATNSCKNGDLHNNSRQSRDMLSNGSRDGHVKQRGRNDRQRSTPREPVNEKGYKKRIREQLIQATNGSDIDELEHAILNFEKNKLEDNGDLTDAKDRLEFLYLRKDLRDAVLRRHPGILDKAIYNAESSKYRSDLSQQLENARKLREHLTELDRYRHDILEMDQSTISEIRSYHHPPPGVHEVMMGTYLLLGYEEEKLIDWTDVQCLIGRYGKDSLFREIKNADTIDMNEQVCRRVVKLQSKFSQEKIREVSNGAATFYVWNENMCTKATSDRQHQGRPANVKSANSNSKPNSKQKTQNAKPRPQG